MERIQKIIANSGYCSRRKAEELIKAGKVKLNGEVIRELGTKANYSDQIMVDNHLISEENKVYYLLNKPRSIITSVSDDKKRKTVVDLINTDKRIYPVGRLDYDTTGILILTNNGELANLIMHPKNKIDKVYIAKVKGLVNKEIAMKLSNGVFVDGKKTSKAHVKVKKYDKKSQTSVVELTIHEGRNHQVKKMFEAVGFEVLKLKRERISFLDVSNLKSGEYRKLSIKEVKKLYSEVKK